MFDLILIAYQSWFFSLKKVQLRAIGLFPVLITYTTLLSSEAVLFGLTQWVRGKCEGLIFHACSLPLN